MRHRLADEIPHLRRFARGLARDSNLADDLVQDCVERALTRAYLYDGSRNLRTWLFTILRNIFINKVREERTRAANMAANAEEPAAPALAASQLDTVLAGQILAIVEGLPLEQREVLLLVAVEGLSYREAADVIGAPIGTMMSRLSRAREQLKLQIEGGQKAAGPRSQIRRVK